MSGLSEVYYQVDGHQGDHVLVAPPYTVSPAEIQTIVDVLAESLDATMELLQAASPQATT